METNNGTILWTFLPAQKSYTDASIFPVTKASSFEEGWMQARKTETHSSKEERHPLFAKHQNLGHVFWTKSRISKHHCLLPWFKCFSSSASCLALLYLLRLSEQKKKRGITVPNKYLTSRQALSSWPVCTCHNLRSAAPLQQPMTQLSRGVTDSSNCSECYWHQQSIKGNTDLHICISAFKQRKLEFQLPSLQMYICNAVQNGC